MKIAYFSPLNPQKSGISDYSEMFIPYLSKYAEIDVWVSGFKPENNFIINNYRIIDYKANHDVIKKLQFYDFVVYNIGNNPYYHLDIYEVFKKYPGYVILHEFVLYYLVAGYEFERGGMERLINKVEEDYGHELARQFYGDIKRYSDPLLFKGAYLYPLNRELIKIAKGIIVHSEYTKNLLLTENSSLGICKIGMPASIKEPNETILHANNIKSRYSQNSKDIVIAAFGYIAPTKRIHVILKALHELNLLNYKFILVGEGDYIVNDIARLGLKDNVIITGYVSSEEYDFILGIADICINLRFPSMGETSASLVKALANGKACIVSSDAWFNELPDDIVIKVSVDDHELESLTASIKRLYDDHVYRRTLGEKAQLYAKIEFDPDVNSKKMIDFMENNRTQDYDDLITCWLIKISAMNNEMRISPDDVLLSNAVKQISDMVLIRNIFM